MVFVDKRKIIAHLLSKEHPEERHKAVFFESFGFRTEAWGKWEEVLLGHAREGTLVGVEETPFGGQYAVEGPLEMPDARPHREVSTAPFARLGRGCVASERGL